MDISGFIVKGVEVLVAMVPQKEHEWNLGANKDGHWGRRRKRRAPNIAVQVQPQVQESTRRLSNERSIGASSRIKRSSFMMKYGHIISPGTNARYEILHPQAKSRRKNKIAWPRQFARHTSFVKKMGMWKAYTVCVQRWKCRESG